MKLIVRESKLANVIRVQDEKGEELVVLCVRSDIESDALKNEMIGLLSQWVEQQNAKEGAIDRA